MLIFPTGSMRLNAGAAAAAATTTTTAVLLLFAPSNCPRCLLLLSLLFKPLHDNNKDTTERNDDQFFYLFIFFKSLKIQNSNPVFGSDWIPAPHRCRLICIREFTGRLSMAVTCIDYWWQQIRFDRDVILLCLPELGTNRTVWRAWKFPRNENGTYFSCIYFFFFGWNWLWSIKSSPRYKMSSGPNNKKTGKKWPTIPPVSSFLISQFNSSQLFFQNLIRSFCYVSKVLGVIRFIGAAAAGSQWVSNWSGPAADGSDPVGQSHLCCSAWSGVASNSSVPGPS